MALRRLYSYRQEAIVVPSNHRRVTADVKDNNHPTVATGPIEDVQEQLDGDDTAVPSVSAFRNRTVDGRGNWIGEANLENDWIAPTSNAICRLPKHSSAIVELSIAKDHSFVIVGASDGICTVWDMDKGVVVQTLDMTLNEKNIACTDGIFNKSKASPHRLRKTGSSSLARLKVGHNALQYAIARYGRKICAMNAKDRIVSVHDSLSGEMLRSYGSNDAEFAPFQAVAMSHDGDMIVAAREDGSLHVLDAGDSAYKQILPPRNFSSCNDPIMCLLSHVNVMAISPDKTIIAVADSMIKSVKLVYAQSGGLLCHLDSEANGADDILALAFGQRHSAPRSYACSTLSFIAVGCASGRIHLYECVCGRLLCTLNGHRAAVNSVAISRNGHFLLSGSSDSTAVLWDAQLYQQLRVMRAHCSAVTAVHITVDSSFIVTGSEDGQVIVWNSSRSNQYRCLTAYPDGCSVVSADGRCIVCSQGNDSLFVCNGQSGEEYTRITNSTRSVIHCLAVAADGNRIAAGCVDGNVFVWTSRGGDVCHCRHHSSRVLRISCSDDCITLAICYEGEPGVLLINGESGDLMSRVGNEFLASCVAVSRSGSMLISGCDDSKVRLWDIKNISDARESMVHCKRITCCCFASNEEFALSGGEDGQLLMWSTANDSIVHCFNSSHYAAKSIDSVSISASNRYAVSVTGTVLSVWSIDSLCKIRDLPTEVSDIQFVSWAAGAIYVGGNHGNHRNSVWRFSNVTNSVTRRRLEQDELPVSPLQANEAFLLEFDLRLARIPRYQWPKFQNITNDLRELLLFDHSHFNQPVGDREILPSGYLDSFGKQNLLQLAVQVEAASFVEMVLRYAPHAALYPAWGAVKFHVNKSGKNRHDVSAQYENTTPLRQAVSLQHLVCAKIITGLYAELLTLTASTIASGKFIAPNKMPSLLVFQGNHAPEGTQLSTHAADLIDVTDLCNMGEYSPDLFLTFLKQLRIVPNYDLTLQHPDGDVRDRTYFTESSLLVGSAARTMRGFWYTEEAGRYHRMDAARGFDVSPWVVPLRGVAGSRSNILQIAVRAADLLQQYDAFSNEVLESIVEYKWQNIVGRGFYREFALFILLTAGFILHSVVYVDYNISSDTNHRAMGIVLWSGVMALTLFFCWRESWQAYREGLHIYIRDGWNFIHVISFVMIAVSLLAQLSILLGREDDDLANSRSTDIICAATMPLLAFQFLFYLQGFQYSGTLVRMILKIVRGIDTVLGILLIAVLTWAAGFLLLFRARADVLGSDFNVYTNYGKAVVTVFVMLLTSFSATDMDEAISPLLAKILLCSFLLFMTIVQLNLMIAIMGDKFAGVQENARAEAIFARAKIVVEYERLLWDSEKEKHMSSMYPEWIQVLRRGSLREHLDETASVGATNEEKSESNSNLEQLQCQIEELKSTIYEMRDALNALTLRE